LLTKFDLDELLEIWTLEKFASELGHCGSIRNSLYWGGGVDVGHSGEFFNHIYPKRLELVSLHHDKRLGHIEASSTATVIRPADNSGGEVLLAGYNLHPEIWNPAAFEQMAMLSVGQRVRVTRSRQFVWLPFPIRSFYQEHRGFEEGFLERNHCRLEAVIYVIAALSLYALARWHGNIMQCFSHWSLGMDEHVSRDALMKSLIEKRIEISEHVLCIDPVTEVDIHGACDFLTLTTDKRAFLDLRLGVPMLPILPVGNAFLIDYAWQLRFLESSLFYGVRVEDQNFKGDALEALVRRDGVSVLPKGACRAEDGTSRQIDAAFERGDVLIIVECKAIGRSLGYSHGDGRAQKYRMVKLLEGLGQVDDKARWLAVRPSGRNYEIPEHIRWICPVVVTPFTEFIPTLNERLWLRVGDLPRILKPSELREALKGNTELWRTCANVVRIHR
jgi:hypothetical protein